MITNYINPRIGDAQVRCLRVEHLDRLYRELLTSGSRTGGELASKTVYDVHVIMRSSLADAVRRSLASSNVALDAHAPCAQPRARCGPETWTACQLRDFLASAAHLRLYPALHLAATTGMRRGELAGLRWGDWQEATHRISIARSRQVVGGPSVEVPVKTRTSRRCIDLDPTTEEILRRWHRVQHRDGHPAGLGDPIFTNTTGCAVHPESISQLFDPAPRPYRHPTHPLPRPAPHPRQPARRRRHPDQGRLRTTRPRPPRLHHGHLPTPRAGHERHRRP